MTTRVAYICLIIVDIIGRGRSYKSRENSYGNGKDQRGEHTKVIR